MCAANFMVDGGSCCSHATSHRSIDSYWSRIAICAYITCIRTYDWINTSLLSVPSVFFPATAASSSSSLAWRRLIATLMHAFVTSRVDYCNCLLAVGTNSAAWVVSYTHKFHRGLTNIRRIDLHLQWLDVPERVTFRLCVMVYKCLHDMAPSYLSVPTYLQHRRTPSTALCDLRWPRCSKCRLSTYGRRAFFCACPAAWNSLPDRLKNSTLTIEQFRRLLKSFLYSSYSAWSALDFHSYALYKSTFTLYIRRPL